MRLLITGASGRIGRALAVRLARGHQVCGLDRLPSSTAHWVGDLADRALLQRALQGVDAVVHTAALHAPQMGLADEAEFQRINVQASHTLAELAVAAAVRQRRTRHHRRGAPPGAARTHRPHHRRARHRVHAPHGR